MAAEHRKRLARSNGSTSWQLCESPTGDQLPRVSPSGCGTTSEEPLLCGRPSSHPSGYTWSPYRSAGSSPTLLWECLDGHLSEEQSLFMIGSVLKPAMPRRSHTSRIKFPLEHRAWVLQRSEERVEFLREQPYDLVGDLNDLRPQFDNDNGEDPDEVSEAAVAHTALALLAATAENYAEFRSQGTCTWPGHQARHSCHDTVVEPAPMGLFRSGLFRT